MEKKWINISLGFILLFVVQNIFAQQNINISVGDYIYVKPCKKNRKDFVGIDIYSRSVDYNRAKIDTITGEGFYESFFDGKSSVEGNPLPCIMSNRKFKIASLQEMNDKGKTRRIAMCYTSYYLNIIWIEIEIAMKNNEIEFR